MLFVYVFYPLLKPYLPAENRRLKISCKNGMVFLKEGAVTKQLQDLTATMEAVEQERQAEVWKAFCHVLEQFATVFAGSQVS